MARRLALELTNTEARALLLAASESRVTIEKSLTVPLAAEESKGEKTTPEQRVVDGLSGMGISRLETIAVVGRADVELRLLTIPPAPDEELPDLVRFQASQELPGLDAGAMLDYLPLDQPTAEPRRVLAAVLKPAVKKRLETICHDAKLTLIQIVLRSAASASMLMNERPELREGCCLLVEVLGRRVELSAVHNRQVVFLRHVLLSADPNESEESAESLGSEVLRTRAVVAGQEGGQPVDSVAMIGEGRPRRELADRLGTAIGQKVALVDPLPRMAIVDSRADLSPADRHHATALLGAALDEASDRRPAFDFINPRQPPKPPSRRGTYVLLGLVAAAAVLAFVVINHIHATGLVDTIHRLEKTSTALKPRVIEADAVIKASDEVENWINGEVVWIDELRWLSEQLPPAQDSKVLLLSVLSNDRVREMVLDGLARNGDAKATLDRSLQDTTHQLAPRSSDDLGDGQYQIKFRSSVRIKAQPKQK